MQVVVHSSLKNSARKVFGSLVVAVAILVAGCHRNPLDSGYGLSWVSLTSEPGSTALSAAAPADYTSYVVTIDSIVLNRSDGAQVEALATPEIVDFTQLKNVSELWGTATIPTGTYVSAIITVDYTSAVISVMVNGVPTLATVQNTAGQSNTPATATAAAVSNVTTFEVAVAFDPANPLVITPTYATTSAVPLVLDLDLAASGYVNLNGGAPIAVVNPYFTASVLPPNTNLTRVRGPMINTNVSLGTYTVYVRPFYDEENNLGSLSLFNTPDTIYTINGVPYVGAAGITALAQLSAGSTVTAAYTTFTPDYNAANGAYAGTFYPVYVIAGSTLEDIYTEGIVGDVIARNGNTLTLRGSTLILNTADLSYFCVSGNIYCDTTDTQVLLGSGTLVTADDTTLTGLNSSSIAVGQRIQARGVCADQGTECTGSTIVIDSTGTSATNTGSVRLLSTQLWGPLVSSASGSLVMNVEAINDWPVSNYSFAGNGSAATPVPTSFTVDTATLGIPADAVAGSPVWVNGLFAPFGTAPPEFTASAVNSESSVQVAGGTLTAPGTQTCGLGSQVCEPATLRVLYDFSTSNGVTAPFTGLSNAGFSIDLTNAALVSAVIRIGPENIDLHSLPASPQIVPTTLTATSTFAPLFTVGNPGTSTITPASTVTPAPTALSAFSAFPAFVTELNSSISATNSVIEVTARGVYDRVNNVFAATTVNVVL